MSEKSYPADSEVFFLVCEDIRREEGNKLSFMGVFAGGDIRISVSKDVPRPIQMKSLAVVFVILGGSGGFDARLELEGPTLDKSPPLQLKINKVHGSRSVSVLELGGLPVDNGEYSVTLIIDGHRYRRTFPVSISEPGH